MSHFFFLIIHMNYELFFRIESCESITFLTQKSLTFIVEPVDAIDTGALVIASEQEEVLWILDLVG